MSNTEINFGNKSVWTTEYQGIILLCACMQEKDKAFGKKKLKQIWILLWEKNKNKKTPTKTDFELCFHTHAQTLPRLVLRKNMNQTKFGKDCKCVWYRVYFEGTFSGLLSITVLVILVLKVISSKSPFTVFMKLIFGLCMCSARVRLGSVRIWWLCVNSQHLPSKSSSLNFCPVGWCLLELSPLSGLGQQAAEKSHNTLSTPVGRQPCSGGRGMEPAAACSTCQQLHMGWQEGGKRVPQSPEILHLELSWYIHMLSGWRTTTNILQSYSCCF